VPALPLADTNTQTTTPESDKLYIYALIRADLQMTAGKLASQAGHAYTDAYAECLDTDPDTFHAYRRENAIGGSKVTIQAKNEAALLRAKRECEEAGIPHALVTDSGHVMLPHFDGSPVVTALGIGPCTRAQCRHITKRYQVVK
jgi:peptidyl-tRNA hydrolase